MKLSDLLEVKSRLKAVDMTSHAQCDQDLLENLRSVAADSPPVDPNLLQSVETAMLSKASVANDAYSYLRNYIDRSILDLYPAYTKQSETWVSYLDKYDYDRWTDFYKEVYSADDGFIAHSAHRIGRLSNWQFPAAMYCAPIEQLADLFGFYPVYLIDKWRDASINIEGVYPAAQARKIRFYDFDRLKDFPMHSLGLVASRNHFTHCSEKQLITELTWMVNACLPGGHIVFNFNDCEYAKCARLFETTTRSFLLGTKVREICSSLNLTIKVWDYIEDSGTVWVEAQLPGTFVSKKRAEPLGKIQSK